MRRRFTIAHEIGHLILGHTLDCGSDTDTKAEANQFAAELLRPLAPPKPDFKNESDLEKLAWSIS